jgi:hypothetical protein
MSVLAPCSAMLSPASSPSGSMRNGATVDEGKDEVPDSERPHEGHPGADELDADLLEAARRHREGIDVAKETDGERSPDARSEVNRYGADGVVDLHPLQGTRDELHDNGAHSADHSGLPGAHDVRRRRDAHQPSERGVHDRHDVRPPVETPCQG